MHVAVGHHALDLITFAVGRFRGHVEAAVGEQALDKCHIAVQFRGDAVNDGLGGDFGARAGGCGSFARAGVSGDIGVLSRRRRCAGVHRGDEHAGGRRAEAVDLFRGVQLAEAAIAAGVEGAVRAGVAAVVSGVAGDERDRKCRRECRYDEDSDDFFHECCLLSFDLKEGVSPPFTYITSGRGRFVGKAQNFIRLDCFSRCCYHSSRRESAHRSRKFFSAERALFRKNRGAPAARGSAEKNFCAFSNNSASARCYHYG